MIMRLTCAILLTVMLARISVAAAPVPHAQGENGANAALKYWMAFALLPKVDEDQEKLLSQWNKAGVDTIYLKVPLDAASKELIEGFRNSRAYMLEGAKIDRCDWGLDYSQGIRLLMPHLVKARTLTSLAALDARYEFAQGHWQAGAEDVIALLKLARHLEIEPMMIQQLVAYGIERTAIEAAAPFLPELKTIVPAMAAGILDAPDAVTLEQMVLKEKEIGPLWLVQELKQAERRKPGSWSDVWRGLFPPPEGPEKVDIRPSGTVDENIRLLEDVAIQYDELAKLTALPWEQFNARYVQFVEEGKASNRLFNLLVPAAGKFVLAQQRHHTQRSLFRAALAVVQGGPDKLKAFDDPFGKGSFEYHAVDGGFELKSSFRYQDKPVTLKVGIRP
jgi:hypothetical protein